MTLAAMNAFFVWVYVPSRRAEKDVVVCLSCSPPNAILACAHVLACVETVWCVAVLALFPRTLCQFHSARCEFAAGLSFLRQALRARQQSRSSIGAILHRASVVHWQALPLHGSEAWFQDYVALPTRNDLKSFETNDREHNAAVPHPGAVVRALRREWKL